MNIRIISADVGLTGFFSIIDIENNCFKVIDSFKIEVEEKDEKVLRLTKSQSKAIVKNQTSFKKNEEILIEYISENKDHIGLLEQITNRPTNSAVSMMSLQDSACVVRCLYESFNFDYFSIPPRSWKNSLGISSDKKEAKELFENLINKKEIEINSDIKSLTKKAKNHNQIESVLIAYYYFKFYL